MSIAKKLPESSQPQWKRRSDTEPVQVGDYYDNSSKRYFDQNNEVTVIKLYGGDCYVTDNKGEMIVTILGSCVSACIRDPISKVGGMNHFLLPDGGGQAGESARYGAFAMEELINGLLKLGAKKERLEVKLFGGSNILRNHTPVGTQNVEFVLDFMKKEGIPISSKDLGGENPRRIHYFPDTGKVMMRKLRRHDDDAKVIAAEDKYRSSIVSKPVEGDIDLF